jgi:membrane protein DedA with SNARE-associated domain/rhodanese-related sulfurtransferase
MSTLLTLIEQFGLALVFLNVLLEQGGLPVPAYPTLVITGALLERGHYSAAALVGTAMLAALLADFGWYYAGKHYGRRVMATLCRISLSPDSCVKQTESVYLRWGPASLLVAKFIPGFASVASALAGTVGTRRGVFIVFDALGAALWAGSAVFLGSLFSAAVDDLLNVLEQLGKWGLVFIAIGFGLFVLTKWWQRYRFLRAFRMTRISVDELSRLLADGKEPVIIDVRSAFAQEGGRIPGARVNIDDQMNLLSLDAPIDHDVIVYCACPNEASAAKVAKQLMDKGFRAVRPLHGGIDAWVAAGHRVEV